VKNNNIIELCDLKGKNKKKYRIILSFVNETNERYLIYTDDKLDGDDFIKVYIGKQGIKDEKDILIPVEEDDELEFVESLLSKIKKEQNI